MYSSIADLVHEFGADTTAYPSEFDYRSEYPAFGNIFRLHLTDSVSVEWTDSEFRSFIEGVLGDTTSTSDEVFVQVWDYFCRADSNDYIGAVHYPVNYAATQFADSIKITLYSKKDLDDHSIRRLTIVALRRTVNVVLQLPFRVVVSRVVVRPATVADSVLQSRTLATRSVARTATNRSISE